MKLLTNKEKSVIGMVHLRALPGTPRNCLTVNEICTIAVNEALQLEQAGFDALLIENMHDVPYLKRTVGPEIVASMSAALSAIRKAVMCPLGVQVLAGANREALAIAQAANAHFIRAEGFVFGHLADEGYMESDAGVLMRYRRSIGAEGILIMADIKKKHASHAITSDISVGATAKAAEFFGADGLVVTGDVTGISPTKDDLMDAAQSSCLPIIVGSGVTAENITDLWDYAQGFIIGSYLKHDGAWHEPLDAERIDKIILTVQELRHCSNAK